MISVPLRDINFVTFFYYFFISIQFNTQEMTCTYYITLTVKNKWMKELCLCWLMYNHVDHHPPSSITTLTILYLYLYWYWKNRRFIQWVPFCFVGWFSHKVTEHFSNSTRCHLYSVDGAGASPTFWQSVSDYKVNWLKFASIQKHVQAKKDIYSLWGTSHWASKVWLV